MEREKVESDVSKVLVVVNDLSSQSSFVGLGVTEPPNTERMSGFWEPPFRASREREKAQSFFPFPRSAVRDDLNDELGLGGTCFGSLDLKHSSDVFSLICFENNSFFAFLSRATMIEHDVRVLSFVFPSVAA